MRALLRATSVVALVLAALSPRAASAQGHPQTRQGFWFNGGMGYGSLGCQDCSGREGGLSGGLALGGSLSQKVLLGGGTNAWTKSENGATLTVATMTALMRFYPSATGGFFLLGGLGVGQVHASAPASAAPARPGSGPWSAWATTPGRPEREPDAVLERLRDELLQQRRERRAARAGHHRALEVGIRGE